MQKLKIIVAEIVVFFIAHAHRGQHGFWHLPMGFFDAMIFFGDDRYLKVGRFVGGLGQAFLFVKPFSWSRLSLQ